MTMTVPVIKEAVKCTNKRKWTFNIDKVVNY